MKKKAAIGKIICRTLVFISILSISQVLEAQICTVNAGTAKTFCQNEDFVLDGKVSTLNADLSTILWTVVAQPAGANAVFDNPFQAATTVSGVLPVGNYTFQLQMTCTDASVATQQVTHTLIAGPTNANVPTSYSAGCYSTGAISLPAGTAPLGGESVLWKLVDEAQGTLANANSHNMAELTPSFQSKDCRDGNEYLVKLEYHIIGANGCISTDYLNVTMTYGPGTVYATAIPENVCGLCTELFSSCSLDGSGQWTYSGPGNVTFNPSNDATHAIACVDTPGDYGFTWTVTGGCRSGTAPTNTVSFNDFGEGSIAADAGPDQLYCDMPPSASLHGSLLGTGQTGAWTQVGGEPATIVNPTQPNSLVTGLQVGGGPYEFVWTIQGASCSTQDEMLIDEKPNISLVEHVDEGCKTTWDNSENDFGLTSYAPYNRIDTLYFTVKVNAVPYEQVAINGGVYILTYAINATGTKHSGTGSQGGLKPGDILTWKVYDGNFSYATGFRDEYDNSPNNLVGLGFGLNGYQHSGYYEYEVSVYDGCKTDTKIYGTYQSWWNGQTPNAGSDVVLSCMVNDFQLSGNEMSNGASTAWPRVGMWSMVDGPGPDPFTDANRYLEDPQLTGLADGLWTFRWNVRNGTECDPKYDDVQVLVSSVPPAGVNAQLNQSTFCSGGPVSMTGSFDPSTALNGTWSQVSPAVTTEVIEPDATANTVYVTGLLASTNYTFRWTVANGCTPVAFQDLSFTTDANQGPSPANIPTDTICTTSLTINGGANPIANGTGNWSVLSQPGGASASIITPSDPNSQISFSGDPAGVYVFEWAVSNAPCGYTSRDTLTVYYNLDGVADAGPDQYLCGVGFPYTLTLGGNTLTGGVPQWQLISGPTTVSFSSTTSNTPDVTFSEGGVYRLSWGYDGGCGETRSSIMITIEDGPPVAHAGEDQNRCGGSAIFTLDALDILPANGTGNWALESASEGTSVTFDDDTDPNTNVTLSNAGVVTLRWSTRPADDSSCPLNSDLVTITWQAPADAGDDQDLCDANSTILTGNRADISGVTEGWNQQSGPTTAVFSDASNYLTAISNLTTGTYVFRYTLDDGSCTTTDDVTITVESPELAVASADVVICDGDMVSLSGNTPSSGTVEWSVVKGVDSGSFGNANNPSTTYGTVDADSNYTFRYTITKGSCMSHDYVLGFVLDNNSLSETVTDATCGNSNGIIDLSVEGDDGSLTYSWSNGASSQDLTGVAAGPYTVTVTGSTCSAEKTISVNNAGGPSATFVVNPNPACPGVAVSLRQRVQVVQGQDILMFGKTDTTPRRRRSIHPMTAFFMSP